MNKTVEIETWVSYPARTVNAEDGLRVEFSIPVHMDLLPFMNGPRTQLLCKYRVRKGFTWGQLGNQAHVRIKGYVETGNRGGQYFHCKEVEILEGKPINNADKATKRMVRRMEKAAGVPDAGVKPTKKQKSKIAPAPPPFSGQLNIF
ncbi:hypothetical protein [Arsenicibacter rosenii]|uniref:Uncharacterized protein n=1 Tax=Arsenicibacter rosenii TaxID=1750698 RepID=A0A1S2VA67_9BACT|nr:hypothetical protein [Arsenicibacter rosenii]OIN55637.1 hypothetical protein BLX24_29065 [Arsenicibacter rosenii]